MRTGPRSCALLFAGLFFGIGCDCGDPPAAKDATYKTDAGADSGTVADAASFDLAVAVDGANPDSANPDGTNPDGANPDSANPDSANPDGASPDAGADDAVSQDLASVDTWRADAQLPDAELEDLRGQDVVVLVADAALLDVLASDVLASDVLTPDVSAPDVQQMGPDGATADAHVEDAHVEDAHVEDASVEDGSGGNRAPIASAGSYGMLADESTLDGTGSSDPDQDGLTYTWSEVTSHGVTFDNNGSSNPDDTTISLPTWDENEVVRSVTIMLTVTDGDLSATDQSVLTLYRTDVAYVAANAGGDGSAPDNAAGDVATGLAYAAAVLGTTVVISQGTYSTAETLAIPAGISLLGGFSSDWLLRDHGTYVTTVEDSRTEDGSEPSPIRTLLAYGSFGLADSIDGLVIRSAAGANSHALTVRSGASLVVQNNVITCQAGNLCIALLTADASPLIRSNTISGGTGGDGSTALQLGPGFPRVEHNTIEGGTGDVSTGVKVVGAGTATLSRNSIFGGSQGVSSVGVAVFYATPVIAGNRIHGGSASMETRAVTGTSSGLHIRLHNNLLFGGSGVSSTGVHISGNTENSATIQNNVINGGVGESPIAVQFFHSNGRLRNNILLTSGSGGGHCIYETSDASDPLEVSNNLFMHCPTGLLHDGDGGGDITDLTAMATLLQGEGVDTADNLVDDAMFVDTAGPDGDISTLQDNDWHLSTSTPTTITQGGQDRSWEFLLDADGLPRTDPWSIGAYERDNIVYVREDGSDLGAGSADDPLRTIQAGVDLAAATYTYAVVRISQGTYEASQTVVHLSSGISLAGGYSSDWAERDPQLYPTVVRSLATAGGTAASPLATIFYRDLQLRDAYISGLEIHGASANYVAGLSVFGSMTVVNNRIYSGQSAAGRMYAIHAGGPQPITIRNNYIAGEMGAMTFGIHCQCSANIYSNLVFSGEGGPHARAIFMTGDYPAMISNNIVIGYGGNHAMALGMSNSNVIVRNNNFFNNGHYAIQNQAYPNQTSNPIIENNNIIRLVEIGGTGFMEVCAPGADSNPASFRNNNILGFTTLYHDEYYDGDSKVTTNYSDIADVNSPANTGAGLASGNISVVPGFKAPPLADQRLTADSPIELREGGINGAHSAEDWGANFDYSGYLRTPQDDSSTTGWSIGAHEYQVD